MQIQPYLFFNGRCDEAIALYQDALGAQTSQLMRYKDSPEPAPPGMLPAGFADKVMHASLDIGGATLMLSDGDSADGPQFNGFFVSLTLGDEADARRKFDALAAAGRVVMPMGKTFWSPCFGMVQDRFGLGWMIMVA
ncbi:MAG: VOC family protein [Gallionellaceae bacterium]|nr:VOC family protein [Gallionellaceae bacterium]